MSHPTMDIIESPRGGLLIASCRSGAYLATQVVEHYQELLADEGIEADAPYLPDVDDQFTDGETRVQLRHSISGHDVFLFQALYAPNSGRSVNENYMAFLIAARAFREFGANHVTGVLPYLAYARQDRPTRFQREPTSAKLMADLTAQAGVDRLVTWHPHTRQISGFYDIPVDILPALSYVTETFQAFAGRDDVIVVAPDAGASKFATYVARALDLRSAIASKHRPRPEEAIVSEIIGDFRGARVALIVDDMISSGGTVDAATKHLVAISNIEEVHICISHNLGMPQAHHRLEELRENYHLEQVVVTNSIPQSQQFLDLPYVHVHDLAEILSRVIHRIHYHRSVNNLFA